MKFTVIAQYHPSATIHQPRLWAQMLTDWEYLPEKVDADYIVLPASGVSPRSEEVYLQPVSLDTENAADGGLGQWSVAMRDASGRLIVVPYYGARPNIEFRDLVIMHNAKWDLEVLHKADMREPEKIADTMIAAYCLGLGQQDVKDSGRPGDQMVGGLGLKYLGRRHLGMNMRTWEEVKDDPSKMVEYNMDDSVATYLLFEKWKDRLPEHFWTIDMPLLRVLMAMEKRGIAVDPDFLRNYAETLDKQLAAIDLPLNPFSGDELRSYIYGTLAIEPWQFTDTGLPSTDAEVLESIDDPVIQQVLDYKGLYKEKGTYVDNYVKRIDTEGRIHCEFKQTRTATGRLACANPNLQNVVKSDEMRSLFVAPEGKLLVRIDWSQMEFGVMGALAQDQTMIGAYLNGDVHQETADALGIPRDDGKVFNLAVQYGAEAWIVSQECGVSIDEARQYIRLYHRRFPAIKRYHEEILAEAHKTRTVRDYFNRVRRLDALFADDWRIREQGEKEAINMPVQGTAGEIVKLAMIDLHYKHQAPMILQVHDELLFEVDAQEAIDYAHWLRDYIPTLIEVNGVRFSVEVGIGKSWAEAMNNKLED